MFKFIDVGLFRNFGYEGEYIFLSWLIVFSEGLGDCFDIWVKVYWFVCEEICIFEEGEMIFLLLVDLFGLVFDLIWVF